MPSLESITLSVEKIQEKKLKESTRLFLTPRKKREAFVMQSAKILEKYFFEICSKFEIKQFIECGAHDAYASRRIARAMPEIKVIAYEANPYVYNNFISLVTMEGVNYINRAISNKLGQSFLFLKEKDTKSWSSEGFLSDFYDESLHNLDKLRVFTSTLDHEMLTEIEAMPTAIWIDVEGSNSVLLEGAEQFIKSGSILAIYIETQIDRVWPSDHNAVKLCQVLDKLNFELVARDCPGHWGCNLVFVKKEIYNEIKSTVDDYLTDLSHISIPHRPNLQIRAFFGKLKNIFLKVVPRKHQRRIHLLAGKLGSKSSRDLV